MPRKVDFFYFDAGGGHRAAATALRDVVARQGRPWEVRLVNLQELLDEIDVLRKTTGLQIQDGYNLLLKNGWTIGMSALLRALHGAIRLYHPSQVRMLKRFWGADPPDMAVSLIPNFNRALFEAFGAARPGAPFVTILTDFADYPPHFWIERQDQYVICGTPRAAEQAREIGVPPEKIRQASGMILRPQFYEPRPIDRTAERVRLGLKPDAPTGLVLFGGHGSPAMLEIARRAQETGREFQLIFICGRNAKLAERIRALPSRVPRLVERFTSEIPYYMQLSDFLIGKPGPGSISEALAMKLPVIVERNAWTMPQERFNARWVEENQVGIAIPSFRRIGPAMERLLEPATYERLREAARKVDNRAVFEIPEMLNEILEGAGRTAGARSGP
ncbi:MAG: galactosyldiacylglycerol synthase [Bryobacteraceae bacterium]|nr:galactosyldiacylglycerol synthase [Bryobacteraceae bacterium]